MNRRFEKGYHSSPVDKEEVAVTVIRETTSSFLLARKSDGVQAFFPTSEVVFKRRNIRTGDAVAEIPTWLLTNRNW